MTGPWRIYVGFWVLLGLIATAHPSYANPMQTCERPLTVRVSETYIPFSFKNELGAAAGKDVALISQIMADLGCEVTFVFLPWKRALLELEQGHLDILPSASITPERQVYALFSQPYRNEVSGLVVRKEDEGRFLLQTIDDIILYDMKLGHVRGAYRGELFEQFQKLPGAPMQLTDVSISEIGFNLLLKKRIDGLVGIPAVTLAHAERMGIADNLIAHSFIFGSDPIHLMYSRKSISQKLVDRINDVLTQAIGTSVYQDLYGLDALDAISEN
ncbi:substrate-binding periplasmic protein [Thalassospira lucentensis]|uniref:substrate-binding periplasmic protein n=1 Tax=Thalassospira lucentensis TaxID=168935 RepID=UPI003D2EC458